MKPLIPLSTNLPKPRKGAMVRSVLDGTTLGIVDNCGGYKGNVCYLTNEKTFIWRFIDGYNSLFSW